MPQFAYLSSSNGKFHRYDYGFSTWGAGLAAGDLNGDGLTDIVSSGFIIPDGATTGTAFILQQPDGSLAAPNWQALSGNSEAFGDFDGDGRVEIADYYIDFSKPLWPTGLRVNELASDGTLGDSTVTLVAPIRLEEGRGWNGPNTFSVRLDANGKEYVDGGIEYLTAGDLNGDGRDDLLAVRGGFAMNYVDGVLTQGGESMGQLELYSIGSWGGFERMNDASIKGWLGPEYGITDVHLIDWNGDGHLDIFVTWPFPKERDSDKHGARIFVNDGAAHFAKLNGSYLPEDNPIYGHSFDPIDANDGGIMDLLARPEGFDSSWSQWGDASETLFLGTKRFYTGPKYENPALRGAAGFNEQYYLNAYADAAKAVKKHKFDNGLDHYLDVGKAKGYFGFAAKTHIFGSDKNDTIKAREGHERLDGGLGKDTLTGKAGGDEFVFSTKLGPSNVDTIKDFRPGQGDTIGLDRDIFKKVGAALGEDEFFAKKGAAKAHDRDDRIIYDTKTGKLYYDDDGSKKGGHDAVHFATLGNKPVLDAGDFHIV